MPKFHITIVNGEFSSINERECPDQESARRHAVESALAIASEQVVAGKPYFGAHVSVREGDRPLIQMVISVGAAPLTMVEPVGE